MWRNITFHQNTYLEKSENCPVLLENQFCWDLRRFVTHSFPRIIPFLADNCKYNPRYLRHLIETLIHSFYRIAWKSTKSSKLTRMANRNHAWQPFATFFHIVLKPKYTFRTQETQETQETHTGTPSKADLLIFGFDLCNEMASGNSCELQF